MRKIALPIKEIGGSTHGEGWNRVSDMLVNTDGDVLEVVATNETNGMNVVATVFFNGLPMLVVFGDEDYRYQIIEYIEMNNIVQLITFWTEVVTELGVTTDYAGGSVKHTLAEQSDLIRDAVDAGMTVSYWDEFSGEGHEVIAFVGTVARALHQEFPDATPEPKGF